MNLKFQHFLKSYKLKSLPVTQVAAACDRVTPKIESACLPYHPETLPDGFPIHGHLTGREFSFQQHSYTKFPGLHVSWIDGVSCFYFVDWPTTELAK